MGLRHWMFAASYDLLDRTVQARVVDYRKQTAGEAKGEVLEIGAGTGSNLPFYSGDVQLTAVDQSPHMLKRLQKRALVLGRRPNVLLSTGEVLPFRSGSFDNVVTTLVLCMVDHQDRVLGEARRVLRPGGRLLFYEHVASTNPIRRRWENRVNPVWRFATTGCSLNRDTETAIRAAGFSCVNLRRFDLSVGLPVTLPNIVGTAVV